MRLRGRRLALVGSTSGIARALARELALRGAVLHLGARDVEEASRDARDLEVRAGVPVTWSRFDALDTAGHRPFLEEARARMGGLDGVIVAFGRLGDQERARTDFAYARELLDLNFTAPASVLCEAAEVVGEGGFLLALGSVAGDRGRQSNYTYGAAKAGLHVYLQGLRNRLAPRGIRVITIKPGVIDTPMTFGMGLKGGLLASSPETCARGIVKALLAGREEAYVPGFWAAIMAIVRNIPEPVFKRLNM